MECNYSSACDQQLFWERPAGIAEHLITAEWEIFAGFRGSVDSDGPAGQAVGAFALFSFH